MSSRLLSSVWDLDLAPTEKLAALALAEQANDFGHISYADPVWLAIKMGRSVRTAQRALRRLEELEVIHRPSTGRITFGPVV